MIYIWQIQTVFNNGEENYAPFIGTLEAADEKCANMIANDSLNEIYTVVLHREGYQPGAIATNEQIAGDYQSHQVPGSVKWIK